VKPVPSAADDLPEHVRRSLPTHSHLGALPTVSARLRQPRGARRVLPLLAVAVALLAAGCASADGATVPTDTATRDVSLRVDGRERSYLLEPALDLRGKDAAALVIVLHQEGGTPRGVAAETELQDLRKSGATLAYPAGVDNSWDAGACCGTPSRQGVDDVQFLDAVIQDVSKRTPVDSRRTALVGYSSGGMLTYRYVCARRGTLAAAVVVSGSLESSCDDEITVPDVLALHGKKDGTIGLTKPVFVKELQISPRPAASSLQILTRQAACSTRPTRRTPSLEVKTWDCRGGVIEARLVPDAGHGWGGLGASTSTREFLRDQLLGG
jgi:polyhydroxybutyrate depolymerase